MRKILAELLMILTVAAATMAVGQTEPPAASGTKTQVPAMMNDNPWSNPADDTEPGNMESMDKLDSSDSAGAQQDGAGAQQKNNCNDRSQTQDQSQGNPDAPQNHIEYGG